MAHIVLNRPEAANALNLRMSQELFEVAVRCDEDPAIRAVLISAEGRLFGGGGDLKEFSAQTDLGAHIKRMTTYFHSAISRWARMDAPVVGAINGTAGGAAFSLVCACDLVVASEKARFTLAYTRAGLTPDGSSTYFLPRLIGARRALELALTNRILSAEEALAWGIVTRLAPADGYLQAATELAHQLSQGPTRAFGVTKRLLQGTWAETLETQMELEARAIADMTRTEDGPEGIKAFLAKRTPEFKGR